MRNAVAPTVNTDAFSEPEIARRAPHIEECPPLFATLDRQPPDPLLSLIGHFRDDPRPEKMDLGVGVYRNDQGSTPVMRAVKAAERWLVENQPTKSYIGPEGDPLFVRALEPLVFGERAPPTFNGVQTPGGTGALRLGAELIRRANPGAVVWVGEPTWPTHAPVFEHSGLAFRTHRWFEPVSQRVDLAGMLSTLEAARAGDVVLLHGCSHNPTGAELSPEQWGQLVRLMVNRRLVPFIDLAYHGLGLGLDEDAAGTRACFQSLPEALLAYSCDKNFGLYRERTGALWVKAADGPTAARVRQNMLVLARAMWSMPPDHGAAVVRTILEDPALAADWTAELNAMRLRIQTLRLELSRAHPRLSPLADHTGMFSTLPIDDSAVRNLREERAIYLAPGARINMAGLRAEWIEPLAAALSEHLR